MYDITSTIIDNKKYSIKVTYFLRFKIQSR